MIYDDIPVLKSIKEYRDTQSIAFHMPGHKRGKIFKKLGLEHLMKDLIEMDTTEVPGVDNLHSPEGAIKEAQELAAKVFGADYTFFLVNGTTSGIYAMILSATKPGDKILIPRNAHRSVVSATILGRLHPVYMMPEIDEYMQIPMGIKPETVEKALEQHPDAVAVVITNPTYYGACSDIEKIAGIVHSKNKLLLVDEAHGSHFIFHPKMPISAMEAGADMAAQSTHKTLASMTGSSMLHVLGERVDIEKVKFYLQLVQTTSPSHVMLASLDLARYIMEEYGLELLDDCIKYSNWVRNELNSKSPFYCLDQDRKNSYGMYDIDPTRITVCFKGAGIKGYEADEILRSRYNIQVEMSDFWNIVAITSVADDGEDYEKLCHAILDMKSDAKESGTITEQGYPAVTPECYMAPYEALHHEEEYIEFGKSPGHISAEMVIPYPPGIPIIMPGEYIQKDVVEYLRRCVDSGKRISGASDPKLREIKVLKRRRG